MHEVIYHMKNGDSHLGCRNPEAMVDWVRRNVDPKGGRDWQMKHRASYNCTRNRGWLPQTSELLGLNYRTKSEWLGNYDACKKFATEYSNIGGWKKGHSGSHTEAYKQGWHRQIANELGWNIRRPAAPSKAERLERKREVDRKRYVKNKAKKA